MKAWLRANRAGLIATAAALPLLAGLLVAWPLTDRGGQEDRLAGSVLAGVRYRMIAAGEFGQRQRLRTPDGTALVAAVIEATPVDPRRFVRSCTIELAAAGGGGQRTWLPAIDVERYGYTRGDADRFARSCTATPTGRYRIEVVFLAPAGTAREAALEVTALVGARQQVVRLPLPEPKA